MAADAWLPAPLPPEAVAAVRVAVDRLVVQVVDAIAAESAEYGDVLGGPEGTGIRIGIEQAVRAFLDAVERGERPGSETAEIWRRLGEAEFQAGRGLDGLRAAFRTGTRAVWRGAADLAASAGIPTPLVISLAEAIFVFSDELASEVVEGYLRMQSDEAGELERRRRRLAALLLDEEGWDGEAVVRAAALARWPLPRSLAVLAIAGQSPGAVARRLGVDALVGGDAIGVFLVVPDPEGPGRPAELERAAAGELVCLGPTVVPRDAGRSLGWARLGLRLSERGALAPAPGAGRGGGPGAGRGASRGAGLTRVDEHLGSLVVLSDEGLAAELMAVRLAPLLELPETERDRLLETLAAWLAHQRHVPGIAAELHVHPQTVRYRVTRLRELLGDGLDDPDGRFELELALRVRRALAG